MISRCARLHPFCEAIWPALLWSAMARSGTAWSSLRSHLGSRRLFSFCGWLSHAEVLKRLRSADVFVFPSLRDNGAGVVFEALATGAVPVVADFGGPGDIVHPEVGYKVPLTNESDIVAQMEKILTELARNRELLERYVTRNGLRTRMPNLGREGKEHNSGSELGFWAGFETRPSVPQDAPAFKLFSWLSNTLPKLRLSNIGNSESRWAQWPKAAARKSCYTAQVVSENYESFPCPPISYCLLIPVL